MFDLIFVSLLVILIYKTIVFLLALFLKRNDIADVSWGVSFLIIVVVAYIFRQPSSIQFYITALLVFVWGIRLAVRIALRNKGKKEDFRYQELRDKTKSNFLLVTYLKVFVLQGILSILVSLPILFVAQTSSNSITWLTIVGLIIWIVGFLFEVIGDFQLDKFLSNPENKGQILKTGLWKYSRHPNYFGEITMWWAIFLLSLSANSSLYSIIGPITITFLITKVSGIPLLEKKYIGNREFEEYKRRTSVLIPLPQKP